MGRKRPRPFEGRTFGSLERVVTALVEAGLQDPAAAPPASAHGAAAAPHQRRQLSPTTCGGRAPVAGQGADGAQRPRTWEGSG